MPEPMGSKQCRICGEVKPLTEFTHKHDTRDGLCLCCKSCDLARTRIWRFANSEKFRISQRTSRQTPEGRIRTSRNSAAYRTRYPDKDHAGSRVRYAIKTGRLVRRPCLFCGSPETEAHHDDYSKPLNIEWLCQKHHREVHRYLKYQRKFE
jgi:hypothetical protein